jgi:membrane-bound lytic murein transglycosylase D
VLQYVVQPGDNLIKIASKFGTTVSKIQKVNNIKDSTVNPGEMLVISDDNDGFLYTIPDNINVVVFANKYNLNVADFMSLNYIQDESEMLYQGQDVFVNLTQEQAYDN